jgi:serine/threonine protein kinase
MSEEYIGSYKVLEKLGAGGMAQVFLAVHQDVPNLKVVLKVLSDPRLGERFKQEADKLALLDGHPNICRIKHFFSHGDDIVIAMEYIDGVTLEEKIDSMRRLEVQEAVQICGDVLDILSFAHQKDIYHRDIKPGNIMVDKSGQVKVIDFGIAKGKTDPNLTIAGTACGTPAYMAPEQFNPTDQADYALWDIYAVGTTLYMMLTGECPFKGDNPFALRDAKLFSDPPSPRSLNPEIPKPLEDIVLKSLARESNQRYQTADEMRTALSQFVPMAPAKVSTPPGGVTLEIPRATGKKTNKLLWPVLGAVAAAALAFVGYKFVLSNGTGDTDGQADQSAGDTTTTMVDVSEPQGILEISVKPKGDIYLDDSLLKAGTDAWMHDIDTGRHVVRVENNKAISPIYSDTFSIMADSTQRLNYVFAFPAPKPPPQEKKVQVRIASIPLGSTIYIDGKRQAKPTPFTYYLKKGKHRIRLEHGDGAERLQRDTTINAVGDTLTLFLNLSN